MKNTQTYKNLCIAFAGESQAQQRYKMFAEVAKDEGYNNISNVFLETARNEYQHAKKFYELLIDLVGGIENLPNDIMVDNTYPLIIGDTYTNLVAAANGESEEVGGYAEFAAVAKEEGFNKVAGIFKLVGNIENHHSARYTNVANLLKDEMLLSKEEVTTWICEECGHIHTSKNAPGVCPVCSYGIGYFTELGTTF